MAGLVAPRLPAPLQDPGAVRAELERQRLVELNVESVLVEPVLEHLRIGGVQDLTEGQAAAGMAGEDEGSFDSGLVVVRPSEEAAGAAVGTPATRASR